MEILWDKRESGRKCLNHAGVHASAQSFDRCEPLAKSNTGNPRFTDFPSLCACSESSLTILIRSGFNLLSLQSHNLVPRAFSLAWGWGANLKNCDRPTRLPLYAKVYSDLCL